MEISMYPTCYTRKERGNFNVLLHSMWEKDMEISIFRNFHVYMLCVRGMWKFPCSLTFLSEKGTWKFPSYFVFCLGNCCVTEIWTQNRPKSVWMSEGNFNNVLFTWHDSPGLRISTHLDDMSAFAFLTSLKFSIVWGTTY